MTTLTRSTRRDFVALRPEVRGLGTRNIRVAVRMGAVSLPAGWRLPEGHVALAIRQSRERREALAELAALYA